METRRPLPKLFVVDSGGAAYTQNTPRHLEEAAGVIDSIRSPLHIIYDKGNLFVGTRVNAKALGEGSKREERYAIFTQHDPKKTSVRDAAISHLTAMARFNESAPNMEFNSRARRGARLEGAYFDFEGTAHEGKSKIGITAGAPEGSAPILEFIRHLEETRDAHIHGEAIRKIIYPEGTAGKLIHASLDTDSAAAHVNALARIVEEHIRQKPDEPLEAAMPRYLRELGNSRKTIFVGRPSALAPFNKARVELETGKIVEPPQKTQQASPQPKKDPGLFGRLFKK